MVPTSSDVLTHSALIGTLQGTFPCHSTEEERDSRIVPLPDADNKWVLLFFPRLAAMKTQNQMKTSKSKHTLKTSLCVWCMFVRRCLWYTQATHGWGSQRTFVWVSQCRGSLLFFFLTAYTRMACELPGSLLPQSSVSPWKCRDCGLKL